MNRDGGAPERLFDEEFRKVPKVDLHCHIDGALRVSTIIDLARKKKWKLPTEDPQELVKYVTVPETCRSLGDFLKTFEFFYPLVMGPAPMERLMYELCADMAHDGVVYFEGRFAPVLQAKDGDSMEDITKAVIAGAEAGKRDFGIDCGVILCCYRPESPESSVETVKLAEKHRGVVVGVDLAGNEAQFPIELHREAFDLAKKMGLKVTIHAGEAAGPESVKAALETGYARRIGHGVRMSSDEPLMARVKDEDVLVECCLSSNLQTCAIDDLRNHPFPLFRKKGIAANLNTDDPGVSALSLSYEYALAKKAFGLSHEDLKKIALLGIDHAFCDDSVKTRVRQRIDAGW